MFKERIRLLVDKPKSKKGVLSIVGERMFRIMDDYNRAYRGMQHSELSLLFTKHIELDCEKREEISIMGTICYAFYKGNRGAQNQEFGRNTFHDRVTIALALGAVTKRLMVNSTNEMWGETPMASLLKTMCPKFLTHALYNGNELLGKIIHLICPDLTTRRSKSMEIAYAKLNFDTSRTLAGEYHVPTTTSDADYLEIVDNAANIK